VRTKFTGLRGPRLNFEQQIEREGVIMAEAEVVAVAIHPDGRVRRPSAAEISHWEAYKSPSLKGP
jgi:acyl-CoA thioester hydrolase